MTKTVLLGDVAAIKGGKRLPKGTLLQIEKNTHPYLRIVDMGQRHISKANLQYVPDEVYPKISSYITNTDDVLISIVGTIGLISFVDESLNKASLTENCAKIVCDTGKVSSKFLYYFLKSSLGQSEILAGKVGSTQPKLPLYSIAKIKLPELAIEEQGKIGTVLERLDQKIELNRRMNETLEKIGQTLFKHYFITNPDRKNWEERKLGDFVELVTGASYKSSELASSDTALITLGNFVRGGGFQRKGYKEFTGKLKETQIIHDGDILVAHTDVTQRAEIAGVPALATGTKNYKDVGISMDVSKVNSIDKNISSGFLYFLLMSPEFQNHKSGYVSGTTVLHLNKKCIPSFSLKVPSNTRQLGDMSAHFQPLIEKIAVNEDEAETLTNLRDSLLPRLISGRTNV